MICHVVRYYEKGDSRWGVLQNGLVYPLSECYETTADFIKRGRSEAYSILLKVADNSYDFTCIPYDSITPLSPITKGGKVLCQGANYRQHMIDSGMNPDSKNFNMFFNKSSASICSAVDNVVKPDFVKLLDYEVELGLVIGKEISESVNITDSNIGDVVAGILIGNDISARDIQIPQMQFFKGKSYRTFCPLGPVLCLLESEDMHYLNKLQLELHVNGELRQSDNTGNVVFKPAESLSEFSLVTDMSPGDIVLTGTPSGCAMQIPKSPLFVKLAGLLPEEKKWELFIKGQLKSKNYLQVGDAVTATIKSQDGKIDLGLQENKVVA